MPTRRGGHYGAPVVFKFCTPHYTHTASRATTSGIRNTDVCIGGLNRFDVFQYVTTGTLRYRDPARPPDPDEMVWKDTARVDGQTVTRIIVPFEGYAGRYVWVAT